MGLYSLIFVSLALDQPDISQSHSSQDHGYCIMHHVYVYSPSFAGSEYTLMVLSPRDRESWARVAVYDTATSASSATN